ncbi:MAG: hypothetical protein KID00_00890 [Clostridium argentinense]|nr:hypothetical protein [Clostridium argentinense]
MTGSSLTEQFFTDVLLRLESLGYIIKVDDGWVISFSIQKIENTIKNECNVTLIPDGLYHTAIDMICGEVLFAKKQSGKLEGFNLDAALKSVQAGDTTVTYAFGAGSKTPEQRLDDLLSYLLTNGRGEFACYRRIKW